MSLTEEIQSALKSGRIVIGHKESIRFIKVSTPKLIVIAKNAPEKTREEIEYNAKITKVKMEVFDGNSKELGVICGKPFPVTALAIK